MKRLFAMCIGALVSMPISAFAQTVTPTPSPTATPAEERPTATPVATPQGTPAPNSDATPVPAMTPKPVAAPTAPPVWTAKPIGMLALVASHNDRGVNTIDLPLFATNNDVSSFASTARGTRVGLAIANVSGPGLFGVAKVNGVIETDFFGGMPGQGLGDTSPLVRMRLANAKAEFPVGSYSMNVIAGQAWSVFSPMNPKTVSRTFFPEFQGSGNLYIREPMVSVGVARAGVTMQFAVVSPVDPAAAGGVPYSQLNIPGPGELSAAPAGEGRVGFGTKLAGGKLSIDAGLSGRYGTERIRVAGPSISSAAGSLDGRVAFGPFWVMGEAFMGQNLDAYTGLDGTQILVTGTGSSAVASLGPESIATAGGWGQIGITKGPFEVSAAYGDQTLDQEDMGAGNLIRQNQTWTAAIAWRPTPQLAIGVEYNYIETSRRSNGTAPYVNAIARHVDLGMTLSF